MKLFGDVYGNAGAQGVFEEEEEEVSCVYNRWVMVDGNQTLFISRSHILKHPYYSSLIFPSRPTVLVSSPTVHSSSSSRSPILEEAESSTLFPSLKMQYTALLALALAAVAVAKDSSSTKSQTSTVTEIELADAKTITS